MMIKDVEVREEDHTFDPANKFSKLVPVEFKIDLRDLEKLSEDEIFEELETFVDQIRERL
jgi:CRISPR/Cas system endoribonuclease Cas6 (RAMP superfamily)